MTDHHRHRVAMFWADKLYALQQRDQGRRVADQDNQLRKQCEVQAFYDYDNDPDLRANAERLYASEEQSKKEQRANAPQETSFKEFISKFSSKE